MLQTKRILTSVGTLGCAVAIGFVMQGSERAQSLYGAASADDPAVKQAPAEEIDISNVVLDVEGITLTSGELDLSLALPAPVDEVITVSAPEALPQPALPESGVVSVCALTAAARPIAAAMVNLTLAAPCLPNERVTVHHNGMIFTQTTSDTGTLNLNVPALAEEAVFIMAFANGDGAVAQTKVEDISDFDRVVLQWKGDTGFEIHAREFGAAYGGTGHVWLGAPGDIAGAITGSGGFSLRYGDAKAPEPLLAEVYSFPKDTNGQAGIVELSVETEVSDINCGLEIEAQTLEIVNGGAIKTRSLTLSVPECDAAGNFLVLNNLLQDLRVAAN